jgi:hypothetical protein
LVAFRRHPRASYLLRAVLFAGIIFFLFGCGDSNNSESELAKQQEIAAARKQGAEEAHQKERIRRLEEEVRKGKVGAKESSPQRETTPSSPASVSRPIEGDWPGGSGFTAIIGSLSSESEARSLQSEATQRGLDAGILYSSDFNSLRPGYWVVFSGAFPQESEAVARADRAHELGYEDAYPRFVAQ